MFSFPFRDTKSLGAGKMCSYLLLMTLQLACCQGTSVDRALRDIGEAKHIVPKQVSAETNCSETNQTVVCACGSAFESEVQELKRSRIHRPSRTSSPGLQFLLSPKK
jgi:hypothetical protein